MPAVLPVPVLLPRPACPVTLPVPVDRRARWPVVLPTPVVLAGAGGVAGARGAPRSPVVLPLPGGIPLAVSGPSTTSPAVPQGHGDERPKHEVGKNTKVTLHDQGPFV